MTNNQLNELQNEETLRAMDSIIDAWGSNTSLTIDEMCDHLEELILILEGNSDFQKFILNTQLSVILHS